jgi:hypothetical protein
VNFEWDENKNAVNIEKHGLSFETAQYAFADPRRLIERDNIHSNDSEERYFCHGMVGDSILTVRFTLREKTIRIFGAAHWRKGARKYENR